MDKTPPPPPKPKMTFNDILMKYIIIGFIFFVITSTELDFLIDIAEVLVALIIFSDLKYNKILLN